MAEYECKNCKNEKICPSKKGSHKYCFDLRVERVCIERAAVESLCGGVTNENQTRTHFPVTAYLD